MVSETYVYYIISEVPHQILPGARLDVKVEEINDNVQ